MAKIIKCGLCENTLSGKNRSKEHIIPNAIGGRKKAIDFICKACNSAFGENWDAELARQMNWFSLAVGISRDRGDPPKQIVQTVEGDKYWLLSDGSLTPEKSAYSELDHGDSVTISMTSKTIEEAKHRLEGVARKYPKFDVEKAVNELEVRTNYLDSPLNVKLSFGGANAGRSLVKTAFAFASYSGVAHDECEKALEYLLDETIQTNPFGFAYLSDLVENRPKDKIFHCVSLHGDPTTKRLWSYIEYFGLFRVVVLLGENYSGSFKNELYAIDPIDGSNVVLGISCKISNEEFATIMRGEGFDQENHKAAADYAFPIIHARGRSRTIERAVREGFNYAAQKLGIKEGEIVPKEKAEEFTAYMMEKFSPLIEHLVRSSRRG